MRPIPIQFIFAFVLVTLSVSTSWAQTAFWSPSNGTLQQGKANTIDLFFEGAEPQGQPEVPNVPGLDLRFRGTSTSTSVVNGRVSAKTIYSYQAIPAQLGAVTIPSFSVETSGGQLQVPAARYEIVEATVGSTGVKPDEVFLSHFQIRDEKIYEGEVFEIDYFAGAKQEYQLVDLTDPVWNPTELVSSGLHETQSGGLDWQGERYIAKAYRATAMATESGYLEAPAAKQNATVVVGRRRDFLFQEPVYDSFTLESDPFTLEILPLPDGAPTDFSGAVGQFTLESRVVPEEVQVGEPVTWTLELAGVGNWPAGIGVPPRSVSSQFRAIQPDLRNEFPENDLFNGKQSEDIVLIPTSEGTFQFGPISFSYFDPKTEEYKTIAIPEKTVVVNPAASSEANDTLRNSQQSQDANGAEASDGANLSLQPTGENVADIPPTLPKEPLAGSHSLPIPTGNVDLILPALTALGAPLGFWLLLAVVQSVRNDPKRKNREGLRALRRIAQKPLPSEPENIRAMQRDWRAAAIEYFGLSSREPSPDEIALAAQRQTDATFAEKWRELWIQSDRILFSETMPNVQSWHSLYCETALHSPKPQYQPTLIFRRPSWLGAIVVITGSCLLGVQESRAEDGQTFYEAGEFAKAEEAWRKAINEEPDVFEYRYNAGLAAAQQKDWGKAWAYWTGAFCLDPNDERVVWNLRLAHANTGAYDPVLQSLLEREGLYRIVRLLSPAGWESVAGKSMWIAGAFFMVCIGALYVRSLRRWGPVFLVIGIITLLNGFFSQWAASKYEALGNPSTLLVTAQTTLRSIPSDLSDEQIATDVQEGTIAFAQKNFLGWTKVQLANGETGWMRNEGLLPLYGPVSSDPARVEEESTT